MEKQVSQAKELERFLNFLDECDREYKYAYDCVGEEDKRLQDLLHEMEFASDRNERNRAAVKLQKSRRDRRRYKDIAKRYEKIVTFFEEPGHRNTLNKMRQLLGQQRKEEEYLSSERTYRPRAGE